MSPATVALSVGNQVRRDGELLSVVEVHAREVKLRNSKGAAYVVQTRDLVTDPSTTIVCAGDTNPTQTEPIGAALAELTPSEVKTVRFRLEHVHEVITGFRSGFSTIAQPNEPRPEYDEHSQSAPNLEERVTSKVEEIGYSKRTIYRWIGAWRLDGPAGLINKNDSKRANALGKADYRWIDAVRAVLDEQVEGSKGSQKKTFAEAERLLNATYGRGVVPLPSESAAYRAMKEIGRGTNAHTGSTKTKRSIATRPTGVYGRLRATRPGEYVILDTTPLDVYAMDELTGRWVRVELSIALDLYSRTIVGLQLSPMSTTSTDIAGVLFETVRPHVSETPEQRRQELPYAGVPSNLIVIADDADVGERLIIRGVAAETIVIDHGRCYLSDHVMSVCMRLGISIQPVRPYQGSDKGPLERWFRTLTGLLENLVGYKGPDIYSRGANPEGEAFYYIHELEEMMRQWIAEIYHVRPHDGLCIPEAPGLELSPNDMFDYGMSRVGAMQLPASADIAYDFLPVVWRTIQHYGVEANLRYNGPALNAYRNTTSPYTGKHAGKWPFRYDRNDLRYLYFWEPEVKEWARLKWEHADAIGSAFSKEALTYAKKLAATQGRFPDTEFALEQLLGRWDVGQVANQRERAMAVRRSMANAELLASSGISADDDPEIHEGIFAKPETDFVESDVAQEIADDSDSEDDLDDLDFYADALGVMQ